MADVYCNNCGHRNPVGSNFCSSCGAVLETESADRLGFGRAANQGMEVARGDLILLLNSDALLQDGSLLALAERLASDPTLGVVGPRIVLEEGRLQSSARRFPSVGRLLLSELWLHRLLSRGRAADLWPKSFSTGGSAEGSYSWTASLRALARLRSRASGLTPRTADSIVLKRSRAL